jgi:tubulin monoglycylase TTLL3/8
MKGRGSQKSIFVVDTWKEDSKEDSDAPLEEKFPDVCRNLLERGWEKSEWDNIPGIDFKWKSYSKIRFGTVKANQYVNHLEHAHNLSNKGLICQHLHTLRRRAKIDTNAFYPRCWSLEQPAHFKAFLQYFAVLSAATILELYLADASGAALSADMVDAATMICKRFVLKMAGNLPDEDVVTVAGETWGTLFQHGTRVRDLVGSDKAKAAASEEPALFSSKKAAVAEALEQFRQHDPQHGIYKNQGIWILKPAALSCGQGIQCFDTLEEIIQAAHASDFKVVVQKYIERPLLVRGHKFDIRQWVLVTDVSPLTLWFWSECYLRFAQTKYDSEALGDRYIHLCNHSVQKAAGGEEVAVPRMWSATTFAEHLRNENKQSKVSSDPWSQLIAPKIKETCVKTLLSVDGILEKKGRGFEWLGFDYMVDLDHGVWLIEVNVSPDVSHSTEVTAALVPPAFDQMFELIFDNHSAMKLGDATNPEGKPRWECIYKGGADEAKDGGADGAGGATGAACGWGRGGRGSRGGRGGRGRRPSGTGTKKRATKPPSESSLDIAVRLDLLQLSQQNADSETAADTDAVGAGAGTDAAEKATAAEAEGGAE